MEPSFRASPKTDAEDVTPPPPTAKETGTLRRKPACRELEEIRSVNEHDTVPAQDAGTYSIGRVFAPGALGAVAGIGIVLAGVAGAFAYVGGWLSLTRLTPARVVDQFERTNGVHPGFRRNHPKGVCFSGWFDSDSAGQRLSKAQVFAPGRTPIFGRFAIANGQPALPDMPATVHSMAVNFTQRDGQIWRTGMNGIPIFTVHSVQDLVDQLAAATPDPTTGKPDPARMTAFMASHPQTARVAGIVKATPLASAFANTTYNSLDAFIFVNDAGHSTPVRWSMVAEDRFEAAPPPPAPGNKPPESRSGDPNAQFTALAGRMKNGPIRWRLVATIGQPGDPTDDPTIAWPATREQVQLGVLTVDRLEDEAHGACRDVTFDPLILPDGIKPSDDPILSARSAAYAQSFRRRAGEPAPVSAVRFSSSVGSAR